MKKVWYLFASVLIMQSACGVGIDVEVVKPPKNREFIWCIQSPFDNLHKERHFLDGGSIGVRVTMVSGKYAYLMRYAGIILGKEFSLELSNEEYKFRKLDNAQNMKVFLYVEGELRQEVVPGTKLCEEIVEAFETYLKEKGMKSFYPDSIETFLLEILETEPVAGGDATR